MELSAQMFISVTYLTIVVKPYADPGKFSCGGESESVWDIIDVVHGVKDGKVASLVTAQTVDIGKLVATTDQVVATGDPIYIYPCVAYWEKKIILF